MISFSYLTRLELDAQQVNVGTSGAEIGAAFGGNKVRFSSIAPEYAVLLMSTIFSSIVQYDFL